jgi:hypothetical protein
MQSQHSFDKSHEIKKYALMVGVSRVADDAQQQAPK